MLNLILMSVAMFRAYKCFKMAENKTGTESIVLNYNVYQYFGIEKWTTNSFR